MPSGAATLNNCFLYDENHNFLFEGTIANPPDNCIFSGVSVPNGSYTVEVLNAARDVNNPLGVSNPFYIEEGLPPRLDNTPAIPFTVAPSIFAPHYLLSTPGSTYYSSLGFGDDDSATWSATVDYGDGEGAQPVPLTLRSGILMHEYEDPGLYIVKIVVTDDQGNIATNNGAVSIIPFQNAPPTINITNINYTYTSPGVKTLTIDFDTPLANNSCRLHVNGSGGLIAFQKTSTSCSFHTGFSFDNSNLSLFFVEDAQNGVLYRTHNVFYPRTFLNTVTRLQFNPNNLYIETSIPIRERCDLKTSNGTTVASSNFHAPVNSCIFTGFGTNGPNHITEGQYYLDLPDNGVQTDLFFLKEPVRPQIDELLDVNILPTETYSSSGTFNDSDSSSWTATVDYGEGEGGQELALNGFNFELNHQYNLEGAYTVTVQITDTENNTGTEVFIVTVGNTEPVTLLPIADSYIKQGGQNENEGGSNMMRLQSSGKNRGLVQFSQEEIEEAVGNSENYTATLQFTITDNGNNWGTNGRTIDLHRILDPWIEGNGFIVGNQPTFRGDSAGATWNCGIDDNTANQTDDCSSTWEMTNSSSWPFITSPSTSTTITNNQEGVVEIDVTGDVQEFMNGTDNYGWVIKKTDEGANGRVEFGSRESGNPPTLSISFN